MKAKDLVKMITDQYKAEDEIEIFKVYCFLNNNVAVLDQNKKNVIFMEKLLKRSFIKKQY